MPSVLCDVALWLEHAKELRALSEVVSDPEEKEQMLVVAAGFDRIAELAQEQAALQEQCHRSAHRPARAWRAQKRQARNTASKVRRARLFLASTSRGYNRILRLKSGHSAA
jgi:hypothetical protein